MNSIERDDNPIVGWIEFSTTILLLIGLTTMLEGLAGLLRDTSFFMSVDPVVFNLTTWGWIHLGLGAVITVTAIALARGSRRARRIGIVAVGLNLLAQFLWIGVYPWWGVTVIALDIIVLYLLAIHVRSSGERAR